MKSHRLSPAVTASPEGVAEGLDINEHTTVSPSADVPGWWEYQCEDPKCELSGSGTRRHGLAGFTSRADAIDYATRHVTAVRSQTRVIA